MLLLYVFFIIDTITFIIITCFHYCYYYCILLLHYRYNTLNPLPTISFHFSQLLGSQAARPRIFAGIPSAALYGERRMRWRKQWKCGDKLNAWGAVAGSR